MKVVKIEKSRPFIHIHTGTGLLKKKRKNKIQRWEEYVIVVCLEAVGSGKYAIDMTKVHSMNYDILKFKNYIKRQMGSTAM